MAETRTRSAERATGLTSQFNFFFAEVSSAVKRPDSLTVGVAGPLDPIDIPDDVKTTHTTLASNPDSISVKKNRTLPEISHRIVKKTQGRHARNDNFSNDRRTRRAYTSKTR